VATGEGRAATLDAALDKLGGLDVLVNNAGAVRAGRLGDTYEAEIRAMIEVDLVAPILLTRAALPALRASGAGLVVNIPSGIALFGVPFYAPYAAAKAGLARIGEALRRELKGEGVQVLTVYPGGTDTPMMKSNRAGPELGFDREPAAAVAQAIIAGIERPPLRPMIDAGVSAAGRGRATEDARVPSRFDPAKKTARTCNAGRNQIEGLKDPHALSDAKKLMETLNPRQRDIVQSISLDGQPIAATAARLAMTEIAVRVALHRALKSMGAAWRRSVS